MKKTHSCDICKKQFARKGTPLQHKLIHGNDKPQMCKQKVTLIGTLLHHRQYHEKDEPCSCQTCKNNSREDSSFHK